MPNRDNPRKETDARNQDFIRFEQIEKSQDYRLAEGEVGDEEFDETFEIQTVSMSLPKAEFAARLGAALEDIGFCILVDHGVDPKLYEEAGQRVLDMVGDRALEEKMRFCAARFGSINQGYFPIEETSDIHPDLVEGWVLCRRAFDLGDRDDYEAADFWPDATFEQFFRRVYLAQEPLILPIVQGVLTHLGCDPHLFDERLADTNFALRLNYYPPVPDAAPDGAGRLLGHEDVTLITMLPAPTIEGLQVLNRRNMKWIRLTPPKGSIVLNTGDYMQRITNDRLPSTTHRVSRPRDPVMLHRSRVSFPMNVYLWEDEMLEVLPGLGEPKYPPVRAEEFHTRITSKYYGDDYVSE
jgi:isopenicillin N synthase-like dioxygenase